MDRYGIPVRSANQRRTALQSIAADYHYFAPHMYWMDETLATARVDAESFRLLPPTQPLAVVLRRVESACRSLLAMLEQDIARSHPRRRALAK